MTANLNLDSFRRMVGKDNYGEVRLNQEGQLEKINNHYLQREWKVGVQKATPSENQLIREAFMNAVANAGVDKNILNQIKTRLGISSAGGETCTDALDRRTIAEVLEMVDKSKGKELSGVEVGPRNANAYSYNHIDDTKHRLFKTFNKEFANIFGYNDSFDVTDHQKTGGGAKQGVNLPMMKTVIKHWNGQHPKPEDKIKLSDDQLTVLFNRHGLELRNTVVGRLMQLDDKDVTASRNNRWHTSDLICQEIGKILKKGNLDRGETSLGVQGETRTNGDRKEMMKYAEKLRDNSGLKDATSVHSMSIRGAAKFSEHCIHVEYNNNTTLEGAAVGKSSINMIPEDVFFTSEDFELDEYQENKKEELDSVFNKTAEEVCRVPMKVVLLDSYGETLKTVDFEKAVGENNKIEDHCRQSNKTKLNSIMEEFRSRGILNGREPLEKMLLKSMGQKFVSAATTKIGWDDTDADRKLFLKMNTDGSFSASLHFKTHKSRNMMQFDFKIHDNGDVERQYLGRQNGVAAPRGDKKAKVENEIFFDPDEIENSESFRDIENELDSHKISNRDIVDFLED